MSGESLLTFVMASALLSIAPGPDILFVLTQATLHGKRAGIRVTLGMCTGLVVHTGAVALGIAALFQTSALAFGLLKVAGAFYLLYLAWRAFIEGAKTLGEPGSGHPSAGALFRRGILMNITNPKILIFFLAFLPQFASPEQGPLTPQVMLLGGIFIGVVLAIFTGVAFLAGLLGDWLNRSPGAQRALSRIAGTVYVALALKLLF
jgi:threonine/homoserine/homoserine lactone efflux protein